MSVEDEAATPWSKRFVPTERWVLPAKRRTVGRAESVRHDDRRRVIVQAGFGLCVSFVLAACGARDQRPQHVGPPLGDTHVSRAPVDPTVPPPDAPDYEEPSPGYEISRPLGPPPNQPLPSSQEPAPQPEPQPGVFSPPPAPEGQSPSGPADVPQPELPEP